jgi:hypothetical protein
MRGFSCLFLALAFGIGDEKKPAPQPSAPSPAVSKKKKRTKKAVKKPTDPVQAAASGIQASQLPAPGPLTPAEQKLDEVLMDWSRAYRKGGDPAAKEYAASKSVKLEHDAMWVKLTGNFNPVEAGARMPELLAKVKALGGEVRASFENQAFVLISAKAVAELAELESVWSMAAEAATTQPLKP